MANKLLNLPDDVTTTLFRLIETQLRTDPLLASVVNKWQTWEGVPDDKQEPVIGNAPWVCLMPRPLAENWFSPETQIGTLIIQIQTLTRGTCIDDAMNLWGAMRAALSPYATGSDGVCFNVRLSQAGAWKGLVLMQQPIFDAGSEAGMAGEFRAMGAVSVEYRALARS